MATIRDVARESGVSVATVSYVLNNGPRPVRASTRHRVLEVMRRLNYHPNAMARGLVRRRMYTLGVLFGMVEPEVVTNPYATGVLQGVFAAAADRGYNILLFPKPWEDAARSAAPFRDRRTDGVLLIAPLDDSDMAEGLAALGLPLVIVSASGMAHGVSSVDVDNVAGGRLAGEHLIGLGHQHVAHISGEERYSSAPARRKGLRQALETAGLFLDPRHDRIARYNHEIGYEVTRDLLTLPNPPTALFAGNDVIGLAAMQAARDLGLRVPQDFSVIGFDDIALARMSTPPLTTIRQPLAEMGAEATHLLIDRIEHQVGGSDEESEPLAVRTLTREPFLVVRGSTAEPSA